MKNLKVFGTIALAVVLFAAVLLSMNTAQATQPGPVALVTPVSASVSAAPGELVLFSSKVLTEDAGSVAAVVKPYQRTDIQYIFDQTIITSNAADGAALSQQNVFGKYARVYADVSNTNPVTLTVIGVMK